MEERVLEALEKAAEGLPQWLIIVILLAILAFWKGPEYLDVILRHRRESFRIRADALRRYEITKADIQKRLGKTQSQGGTQQKVTQRKSRRRR